MSFLKFVWDRWLTIYTAFVLVAFGLGFVFKDQMSPKGASFYVATLFTLPWSFFPQAAMPEPVNAFLQAFYDLPLILAGMTMNIAFIGVIQWVCSRLPAQ